MLTENILALAGATLIFTGLILIFIYRKQLFKKPEIELSDIPIPPKKKNDTSNKKL